MCLGAGLVRLVTAPLLRIAACLLVATHLLRSHLALIFAADPDMMQVGNFRGSEPTRSHEEMAHFGLWTIVSSPVRSVSSHA